MADFKVGTGLSAGATAGIVLASCAILVLILVLLRVRGYLGGKGHENEGIIYDLCTTCVGSILAMLHTILSGIYIIHFNVVEFRGLDTGYFTLRQIKAATDDFSYRNKIGEGGFGPVYKVRKLNFKQ